MPETMPAVEAVLERARVHSLPPMTLLVVPGRPWNAEHLDRLRQLSANGHELAAHGWYHRVDQIRGLRHRLHSAILSRDVAEHMALDSSGIRTLMQRSFDWFPENDLAPPSLYVPPAWALGRIRPGDLQALPYSRIEVLSGLLNPHTGTTRHLPMVGFEADTLIREWGVRFWNRLQLLAHRLTSRPLRIGIHPFDLDLRLRDSLDHLLRRPFQFQGYTCPPEGFH
jgi:predicted deacetylase